MPKNFWFTDDSDSDLDPIASLLSEWSDPEEDEEEFRSDFFQGLEGRRGKAALALMMIWGITIALHLVSWGFWLVIACSILVVVQVLRLFTARPQSDPHPQERDRALTHTPSVSLLVAAKNEEAVVAKLVKMLCDLDYPKDKYDVWMVDDHSTDRTPEILDQLAKEYQQLKVLHRPAGAGGGKSGALNEALALSQGEIVAVFDADASVSTDMLRRVVPMFEKPRLGAVQVRKAVANAPLNFWTKGQRAEMALDSYFQQQRIALGGIGELRGNGQFVRRKSLESCGGWNEQTITDDLDLTLRLHLDRWNIGFCLDPVVEEEGVTTARALWHQRSRWAEGGYQRYLDYWRLIASNRLGWSKSTDLLLFVLIHYILPTAAIPDFLMVVTRHHFPILAPLSGTILLGSVLAMFQGLYRIEKQKKFSLSLLVEIIVQTVRGMIYLLHWLVVMPVTTGRMSVRPKKLKWVKTVHQGSAEESFEVT
ncbi:glycosyltransferase family 2 protein [Lusitaniella coriacea LEGE 07157]|uniref:Beta-monoglucosyldiacylglycerol synthase n=1 Tax=Lusitaniella coriacea LEGE 07157 TaxID=945747 RepID=A0A8J7E017_9CYAN|nr:glycosyltransferase family 2 protein [Lusitaniella coriacea]MBE9118869.1 glycosyltransferase family 2 protein [Lusitaniella coriacea LEGE 07157]